MVCILRLLGGIKIILIYKKEDGKVLHYTEYDGMVQPTLLGLYHACIKKNYPDLKLDDLMAYYLDDNETDKDGVKIRQKVCTHDTIMVEQVDDVKKLLFSNNNPIDNPPPRASTNQRIADLEVAIAAILGGAV